MQSLLAQLPTLVGVVIGALATYAVTAVGERSRWRRDQAVRWDEKRVNAYAEYATALKHLINLTVRIAGAAGLHTGHDPLPFDEARPEMARAESQRTTKWEAVLLLGSTEAVLAGRAWHESVYHLQAIAAGKPCDLTWDEAVAESSRARARFYQVAREDLGIATGGALDAFEWQFAKWTAPRS